MTAALAMLAAVAISSPRVGDFYDYPEWCATNVTKYATPGSAYYEGWGRVTPEVVAAVVACDEAPLERIYCASEPWPFIPDIGPAWSNATPRWILGAFTLGTNDPMRSESLSLPDERRAYRRFHRPNRLAAMVSESFDVARAGGLAGFLMKTDLAYNSAIEDYSYERLDGLGGGWLSSAAESRMGWRGDFALEREMDWMNADEITENTVPADLWGECVRLPVELGVTNVADGADQKYVEIGALDALCNIFGYRNAVATNINQLYNTVVERHSESNTPSICIADILADIYGVNADTALARDEWDETGTNQVSFAPRIPWRVSDTNLAGWAALMAMNDGALYSSIGSGYDNFGPGTFTNDSSTVYIAARTGHATNVVVGFEIDAETGEIDLTGDMPGSDLDWDVGELEISTNTAPDQACERSLMRLEVSGVTNGGSWSGDGIVGGETNRLTVTDDDVTVLFADAPELHNQGVELLVRAGAADYDEFGAKAELSCNAVSRSKSATMRGASGAVCDIACVLTRRYSVEKTAPGDDLLLLPDNNLFPLPGPFSWDTDRVRRAASTRFAGVFDVGEDPETGAQFGLTNWHYRVRSERYSSPADFTNLMTRSEVPTIWQKMTDVVEDANGKDPEKPDRYINITAGDVSFAGRYTKASSAAAGWSFEGDGAVIHGAFASDGAFHSTYVEYEAGSGHSRTGGMPIVVATPRLSVSADPTNTFQRMKPMKAFGRFVNWNEVRWKWGDLTDAPEAQ